MDKPAPNARPEATLAPLVKWLRSQKVPGLVIGGIAASILGRPRLTRDVDVLVLLDEPRWQEFLDAGRRFGFLSRIDNAVKFARRSRVFLVHHRPTDIDIDIAIAGLPFEEETIAQVKWTKIGGLSLPLPTPENLIIMKAVAHRPQDLADMKALLDANPQIDLRRVRRWVREFASALDATDICEDLEQMIRASRKQKSAKRS